jgi:hypothetical protein
MYMKKKVELKRAKRHEAIKMKTVTCEGGDTTSKWYSGRNCNEKIRVMENIVSAVCWKCVASKIPGPQLNEKNVATGFPRGWKFFKEFVHEDGRVFHKGEEQPNLRGTLPPTEIKTVVNKPRKKKETLDDKISSEIVKKMRKTKPAKKAEKKPAKAKTTKATKTKTIKPTKTTRRKK